MRKSTILQTPRQAGLTLALILVASLGCSDIPGPTPPPSPGGTLLIANQTSGGALDLDGYQVLVNQAHRGQLELNTTMQLSSLTPGQHSVELRGLAGNCGAAGGNVQTVPLAVGETAQLRFTIHCTAPAELGSLRLVFARNDGLYRMAADGSGLTRLAEGEFHGLAVSPDGHWIAFGRGLDLYLIRSDGSGLRQLTTHGWDPAWSPDGTRLVFAGSHGLLSIAVAGGDPVRLTNPGSDTDYAPAFSPDGTRIAYSSGDGFDYETVWVANADGSRAAPLPGSLDDSFRPICCSWSPIWSPDGSRLVFLGLNPSARLSLFAMDASTGVVSVLNTLDNLYGLLTDWSPDGRWIAFTSLGNQRSELYLLGLDGRVVRVTADGVSKSAAFLRQ